MPPRPPLDELVELYRSLILAQGVTTANGNVGGTSFVDAALIGAVGIVNTTAIIFPGQPLQAQVRDTTVFNAVTGEVTVSAAFSAQVLAGTPWVLLAMPPTVAEVAALLADVGDASASALGSLYAILGNPAQTFLAMVGYEGATALAAKLTAARAALLDLLVTAETPGTFSHPNSVAEQTIFTFSPAGLRTKILGIWLDLVNLTQNATIRVKFQIDGVNYRTFDSLAWTTADDDGVFITGFPVNDDVQVSIQSAVLEGAARDIPYLILSQAVE